MMNGQENTTRLNESIPQETVIKVLFRKIKLQEEEIETLKAAARDYEKKIKAQKERIAKLSDDAGKMQCIIAELSPEERKEMKANPMYKMALIEKKNLNRKIRTLKNQIDKLTSQLYAKM